MRSLCQMSGGDHCSEPETLDPSLRSHHTYVLHAQPIAPCAHSAIGPRRLGATFSASPAQVHIAHFTLHAPLQLTAILARMQHCNQPVSVRGVARPSSL